MTYKCNACNYETQFQSNYINHNKTQKHMKNISHVNNNKLNPVESSLNPIESLLNPIESKTIIIKNENSKIISTKTNQYVCSYCNNNYSTSSNLSKHVKICSEKSKLIEFKNKEIELIRQDFQNQNVINNLKKEIEKLTEMIKAQSEKYEILQKENEFMKKQLSHNNNTSSGSMKNTLNYLVINFNSAPQLKPLEDYSILEEKTVFTNNVIYHEDTGNLENYLSKFIIDNYKTENPLNQSVWNSDCNRLTYINRENVNNSTQWIVDKKGIKMTKYIITPFLNYIKTICLEHANQLNEEIQEDSDDEDNHDKLRKINTLTNIVNKINTGESAREINKFIAPHFQLENSRLALCN